MAVSVAEGQVLMFAQRRSLESQGQGFHLFSAADAAQLAEQVLKGRFGVAGVVFVYVFLLADLGLATSARLGR